MNWGTVFWLLVGGLALGGVINLYQDVTQPDYCKGDVDLDIYKHSNGVVQVINQGAGDAGNVSVMTDVDKAYLRVPAGTVRETRVSGDDPVLGLVGCS